MQWKHTEHMHISRLITFRLLQQRIPMGNELFHFRFGVQIPGEHLIDTPSVLDGNWWLKRVAVVYYSYTGQNKSRFTQLWMCDRVYSCVNVQTTVNLLLPSTPPPHPHTSVHVLCNKFALTRFHHSLILGTRELTAFEITTLELQMTQGFSKTG